MMNPESTLVELSGPSSVNQPFHTATSVDRLDFIARKYTRPKQYEMVVTKESPVAEEESESFRRISLISAVQPDFDHEECYLPSSGNLQVGTVANTNQVDYNVEEHSRLLYDKPLCFTTATNQ